MLSQKYSQLCTAAGLEEQAAKMLKQVKIIGALSKKALKNIADSSTPDPILPDDLVKLLHELFDPKSEDYERISNLVEGIYKDKIKGNETAKTALVIALKKYKANFTELGFDEEYTTLLTKDVESNVLSKILKMEGGRNEVSIDGGGSIGKSKWKWSMKANFLPNKKDAALYKKDLTSWFNIEGFKQGFSTTSGEFGSKLGQANVNVGEGIESLLGDSNLKNNFLCKGLKLVKVEFSGGDITGALKESLKSKDITLPTVPLNVSIAVKGLIDEAIAAKISSKSIFSPLIVPSKVFDVELEFTISYDILLEIDLSKKISKQVVKFLDKQDKLNGQYKKLLGELGEHLSIEDNLDEVKGVSEKMKKEIKDLKGKSTRAHRLQVIQNVAIRNDNIRLTEWVEGQIKTHNKKVGKLRKQLDKLQELATKLKKLEAEFMEKSTEVGVKLTLNANRKLLGKGLVRFSKVALKGIPIVNIITTMVDIYDICVVVVPMIWEALKENGDGIKRVPIPDRVKMLFDWMNEFGSKQYQIPEELPETQIKAYLKFLNSFEDNQAVVDFVKKLMTHPSAGKMLALDNPDAIKALYDAQKTFDLEAENHEDEILEVEPTTKTLFVNGVVDESSNTLIVTKQIFIEGHEKPYEVKFPYSILKREDKIYTVLFNSQVEFADNTGRTWKFSKTHEAKCEFYEDASKTPKWTITK